MITVAGPPSSGKTAVIVRSVQALQEEGFKAGVIKLDCLSTSDDDVYEKAGIKVRVGLSGNLCPDHFFISNIEECLEWADDNALDLLVTESAGLCNRCAPHIKGLKAVCVVDNLMGINAPQKIGPMLKLADIVVITKGDVVSQAEREVFAFRVRQVNPRALIFHVNGITGQGAYELSRLFVESPDLDGLAGKQLRFSMPATLCSYCLGERRIGQDFQIGNIRKVKFK